MSNKFTQHLTSHGMVKRLTVHDTPQQNGVADRLNHVLLECTRALLHASGLPKSLWGEALAHAIWLKNRTSTKALNDHMPLEELTGKKPYLARLCKWGTKVWVHRANQSKLDSRASEGRWVSYDTKSKASQIYWPDKHTVSVERNIKFDNDFVPLPETAPVNVRVRAHLRPAVPTFVRCV